MLIFDFFSGTGSATQAFKDAGHTVITFELEAGFRAKEIVDILDLDADKLLAKYGRPDFIWASPPCTSFSVGALSKHWSKDGKLPIPISEEAIIGQKLVSKTRELIFALQPKYGYIIENPRGMLRKLPLLAGIPRWTITYCQYGDKRQKPTDLWGDVPGWEPKPMCEQGASCHEAAPRGSHAGTQGVHGSKKRSMIPVALGKEICDTIESNLDKVFNWD